MTNDLNARVVDLIKSTPGLKAKQIAAKLGADRATINKVLYGSLKSQVYRDKTYGWHATGAPRPRQPEGQSAKPLDTPLARLSRYYLECLTNDDLGGVSEFAFSKYGNPAYVELRTFPLLDPDHSDPLQSEGGQMLLGQIRRDRNRKSLYLGYPTRLNLIRGKSGWTGYMVEPILLFPFQDGSNNRREPILADGLPHFNFKALRNLIGKDANLLEEAILLAEDLGMGYSASEQPDVDDLVARLWEIRPDWDWIEDPDPFDLTTAAPLAETDGAGIYNRAVLIAAERSPYTKGLETELGQLQSITPEKYANTALGVWLEGDPVRSSAAGQEPLIEVLPLNNEQRQAVHQALENPLTVITGPPGTGKSQVVTSILANAAWQGMSTLFASKNNKAVDVVEARVNGLGPRPVLLRLGASEYQGRLAEYLINLLSASSTQDDQHRFEELRERHTQLRDSSADLDERIDALVRLKNDVDEAERQVECLRQELKEDLFRRCRTLDIGAATRASKNFESAVCHANRSDQGFHIRMVWPLIRSRRYAELGQTADGTRDVFRSMNLDIPAGTPTEGTIESWIDTVSKIRERLCQCKLVRDYFEKLSSLTDAQSLEGLSEERRELTQRVVSNSEALWSAWLRLQPSQLSRADRKLLNDYSAILQLIVSANEEGARIGGDVFRRYYELFPQITSILSCWAVTSLSARGRVPFEPGYFDLLVIDEASQCDIASALPLLFRAKRVVVIGDPKQLRHISTLSKIQDRQLLSKYDLVDDFAGWAYSVQSLFDLAKSFCEAEDIVSLRDHHRSHAHIIGFSNSHFYEDRLRIATRYDRLNRPQGNAAVRWVNVQGKAIRPGSGGAVNETEARAVLEEVRRLALQGYGGSVGVVSPFRAQANRIRDLIYGDDELSRYILKLDFLADTVHKFQGDERDVMIFSPVVSTGISDGALGFLRSTPNLFNVAITRARAALVVVGDHSAALESGVDYLSKFASYARELRRDELVSEIPDSTPSGPEYPPVSNPEQVSDWERYFYSMLYERGVRPIPQYQVEKYILDFALFDGDRRLNIEVDGETYHRRWDGELCRRDQIRNLRMMELGWDVMRFWVYQIRDDADSCVERVSKWLAKAVGDVGSVGMASRGRRRASDIRD